MADPFGYNLIPPGSGVLCALSGGADSMYLLCRLLEQAQRGKYTVRAAHYNHQLRPTSDRDEKFVRDWCAAHGVPLTVDRGDPRALAKQEGRSIEEAARTLRYAFLEQTAEKEGCSHIATGHHAGDNVETVLMNLMRGCGLNGLAGIPECRGNIIRPMLAIPRFEISDYLTNHAIPHMEDESNSELTYTRNRIRHQLLPLMEQINPRCMEHIAAAAARLREDERELSRQASLLSAQARPRPGGLSIPISLLSAAPGPIARRAISQLLKRMEMVGGAYHLDHILSLASPDIPTPSARVDVPGGTAHREYDVLVLSNLGKTSPLSPTPLAVGELCWGDWVILCRPAPCPARAYVSRQEFFLQPGEYLIRSRQEGDRIQLVSRPKKTVKKLMIEEKIPAGCRKNVPVLARGEELAAVGGFGPGSDCLAQPGEAALHIILKRKD